VETLRLLIERLPEHPVRLGITLGARLTLLYAALFLSYAIIRSSFEILIPADTDLLMTFIANMTTILLSGCALMILILIVVLPCGILTSRLTAWLLPLLPPTHTRWQNAAAGVMAAFVIQCVVRVSLYLGFSYSLATMPAATYLFWIGFPSLVHLAAGGVMGWRLGRFNADKNIAREHHNIRAAVLH
jgi:hypothetical protein